MTTPEERLQYLRSMPAALQGHMAAMGVICEHLDQQSARIRIPYRREFLGDPQRQIIHTGVVTSMVDSACGFIVLTRIPAGERIATLDLRVDYLRPSRAPGDLLCEAECYRLTPQIAFARATVWQDRREEPVATALATFMRIALTAATP
jgi:uncharacterized protein (TIGR00369 family)